MPAPIVHDFVRKVDALAADRRRFYLSPNRWRGCGVADPLTWQEVRFAEDNRSAIPNQRGVYAFVVRHDNGRFPPHGFIMYIGITGARSPDRTLRKRFADYLQEKNKDKRPRVHYMLNKYADDLFFFYVPLPDPKFDLGKLELDLNDSILPPVVVKDFTAEIKKLVQALES